jgi:hypothetical protein
MNLQLPQLVEWNDYCVCPPNKVRMGLKLTKPVLFIDNINALAHDFYYLSDEFSVIFHPLWVDDKVHMLVEGPYENPEGERIPILSTWSHLKVRRSDVAPHGIQYNFVFYNGRWWTAELTYNYDVSSIDRCPYRPLYWCNCFPYMLPNYDPQNESAYTSKHSYYPSKTYYTIFKDKVRTEFHALVSYYYEEDSVLGVIADWLEERGDPFAEYLRSMPKGGRKLPELVHMCESIKEAENDRSARLLLLAEGIKR